MRGFRTIFTIFLMIVSINALLITVRYSTYDLSPEDYYAIYGGKIENNYPYAGYVLDYEDFGKAHLCGGVFIEKNVVVTAGHCIQSSNGIYVGVDEFKSSPSDNFPASSVSTNPAWSGEGSEGDLSVIIIGDENYTYDEFAQVTEAEIGCVYEVVGYGQNDNSSSGSEKLRKSSSLCMIKKENGLLLFEGNGGGICFGDSGSPVFISGTNKVVGIISSIYTQTGHDVLPCSINNTAVAVDLFENEELIRNMIGETDMIGHNQVVCGGSCDNAVCTDGLFCNTENVCTPRDRNTCTSSLGEYCAPRLGINCSDEQSICIQNICARNQVPVFDSVVSVINSDATSVISQLDESNTKFIESIIIMNLVIVFLVTLLYLGAKRKNN